MSARGTGSGDGGQKIAARNRKARHEFEVLETFEAGIELKGPEVKSIRSGHVSFHDAHGRVESGEIWLYSLHISPYEQANRFNEIHYAPVGYYLTSMRFDGLAQRLERKD